ncbi:PREDICTED: tetratricopeptide repeat protein 23 [Myotis davidii]|uniref:tetratricopeptide repeat protein 23 n=1 Tax=Myotis davidii TaxID=225400 RepID=UPI0007675389|nr:PREDICTED: tetratricopeptide repeat protein 23 [Myotis davidii]
MQESQETHISKYLDEIVAAVSITPGKKFASRLPHSVLFQPPREQLQLCEDKAKFYSSRHEYKQAIQELVRCVALTRICYGSCHWKLAEAYVNLAQGYLQLKGTSLQAKHHAEKAREILTNSIMPSCDDNTAVFRCSVELFHTLGRALLSLQKFKEAEENLAKAERLSKELLRCGRIVKEEWIETQARIKLSFARMYRGRRKSKEALPYYQEALEHTESSKGEKSLECVPVLRELAGAERALRLHDASINHFLQRAICASHRPERRAVRRGGSGVRALCRPRRRGVREARAPRCGRAVLPREPGSPEGCGRDGESQVSLGSRRILPFSARRWARGESDLHPEGVPGGQSGGVW